MINYIFIADTIDECDRAYRQNPLFRRSPAPARVYRVTPTEFRNLRGLTLLERETNFWISNDLSENTYELQDALNRCCRGWVPPDLLRRPDGTILMGSSGERFLISELDTVKRAEHIAAEVARLENQNWHLEFRSSHFLTEPSYFSGWERAPEPFVDDVVGKVWIEQRDRPRYV